MRLRNGDALLFGCIYRSPTQTEISDENNYQLIKLLQKINAENYSHVCLVGDFNYRNINWRTWTTPLAESSKESKFLEVLRDCFFFQHVEEVTRSRGDDKLSLIDLILTNEELQVSPLGKSDHSLHSLSITASWCIIRFAVETSTKTLHVHTSFSTGMNSFTSFCFLIFFFRLTHSASACS